MPVFFDRLTTATLRERIVEKIQDAILTGALGEGERLVERKLASQFQTSLTSVREALIELEAEGFVTKKPNAATYVTKLTSDAVEKIFVLRRILEVYAIEEAARLVTPEQLTTLDERFAEVLSAAEARDEQLFIRRDFAFHVAIWHVSGNEYLEAALSRIAVPLFACTAIRVVSHHTFNLIQDAQSHQPILEAIRARSPDAARMACLPALDEWLSRLRASVFEDTTAD